VGVDEDGELLGSENVFRCGGCVEVYKSKVKSCPKCVKAGRLHTIEEVPANVSSHDDDFRRKMDTAIHFGKRTNFEDRLLTHAFIEFIDTYTGDNPKVKYPPCLAIAVPERGLKSRTVTTSPHVLVTCGD
jgi:hypothetical protein